MTDAKSRTPEDVRKEIEVERGRLVGAVEHLRSDVGEAKNAVGRLKAKLPVAVAVVGGLGAALKYLVRRGRRSRGGRR
jgi:hypothetical protein